MLVRNMQEKVNKPFIDLLAYSLAIM